MAGSPSLTLDAGALIAVERESAAVKHLLRSTLAAGGTIHVPAAVVAQVWRGGGRQVTVVRLLRDPGVVVHVLDLDAARSTGELAGAAGASDVVDCNVVLVARRTKSTVVTSDAGDIARIDPGIERFAC